MKRGTIRAFGYLAALVMPIAAWAQEADTLLSVVEQALNRSPDLAQSRDDAKIAQFGVSEARAAFLPRVDGGWGRAYNQIAVNGYAPVNYWQSGWTVQLSQPIFDWSKWVDYRSANAARAESELQLRQREQDVMLAAAKAWFDMLAAQSELARADAYVSAVLAHQAIMERLMSGGEATVIDLQEVQSTLENAQLERDDARVQVETKRDALRRLTGAPLAASSAAPRDLALPALPSLAPDDPQQWIAQAETKSYPVQVAQMNLQASDLGVDKARSQRYPVVSLTGSYTPAGAASGYSRPTTTAVAMLSVSIPIFDGGAINAGIDKADAVRDKADDALRAAVRDAGSNAQDSYTRFHWGVERVGRLKTLAATNEAKLDATETGYRVGSRTNLDVLRALDALYAGRRDLLRANYDTLVAFLQLKASTATLGIDDIVDLTSRLDTPGVSAAQTVSTAASGVRHDRAPQ